MAEVISKNIFILTDDFQVEVPKPTVAAGKDRAGGERPMLPGEGGPQRLPGSLGGSVLYQRSSS